MVISPGCICTCKQTGTILYAVVAKADDGIRWQLRSMRIDHKGRTDFTRRIAGEGDLTLIREAPTFEPNTVIEHNGRFHEITTDNGDSVELITPSSRYSLKGSHALHREAGNRVTVPKADLVLARLLARDEEE
jgi:hypothetical protein